VGDSGAWPNGERPPVRVRSGTLEVVDWPVTVDLSEHRPVARPPDGVDPVAHAQEQRTLLARSRVEGLTFDGVLVDGQFPDVELILLFRSQSRRGIVFGRRWPLFDDFGIPQTFGYATIELEEDVVAAGNGLPPVDKCVPDSQGVVWF
jgi:hypothetical protein